MKKHLLLIALQLAAAGNDAYWTNRGMANAHNGITFTERNPIARPFMRSTATRAVYFSSTTALHLTLPSVLRKHGYTRIANFVEYEGIVDNGVCGVYTATHVK